MDQMELFNHLILYKQMIDVELLVLRGHSWNHLTVCKYNYWCLIVILEAIWVYANK